MNSQCKTDPQFGDDSNKKPILSLSPIILLKSIHDILVRMIITPDSGIINSPSSFVIIFLFQLAP